MDYTINGFCNEYGAYSGMRVWIQDNCVSMQEAWDKLPPKWLFWVAMRPGVLTNQELRLFAVWCAGKVRHLMAYKKTRDAMDVLDRFVVGQSANKDIEKARYAAHEAASVAKNKWEPIRSNALYGNGSFLEATDARNKWKAAQAVCDAVWVCVWPASWQVAEYAEKVAESVLDTNEIEYSLLAQWLRENTKPNFRKPE